MKKEYDIFISYSRLDIEKAQVIKKELEEKSKVTCWMDLEGIEIGSSFEDVIINAIDKSKAVIFFLSEHSMNSEFAKKEVRYANETQKKIIPIKIDDSNLYGWFLFNFSGVDVIDYNDIPQRKKLFRYIQSWFSPKENVSHDEGRVESTISNIPCLFKVGNVEFKMIYVEGGKFKMGSNNGRRNEKQMHYVTLSDYCIGETVVTQALWKAVMNNNPSGFKGDNLPVENVSWEDCQEFICKLNNRVQDQLKGRRFALPTEAQWEFAARGGKKSQDYIYSGGNTIDDVAWYLDNSSERTHPVKQKRANELGLYDMSGNVWEWCQDWYESSYPSSPQTDPVGPSTGSYRVDRGGSWCDYARSCRSANRDNSAPACCFNNFGLRLVLLF